MTDQYDFSGWATVAGLKCTDGRVILKDAFKHQDGSVVPLVWTHTRKSPANVLGHVKLENRDEGVYAYAKFNNTESGINAKALVMHGDITALSIFANELVEKSKNVVHGMIREVSLVLAGANPGAVIDNLAMEHGDGEITLIDDEAVIYTDRVIKHDFVIEEADEDEEDETIEHAEDMTVGEVIDTMNEDQKAALYAIIAQLIDDTNEAAQSDESDEGDYIMHGNVFEGDATRTPKPLLTHDQFESIMKKAQQIGSFKEAFREMAPDFLEHAGTYGIDNIDYLFPDAKAIGDPEFVSRDMEWVAGVLTGTRKSRFSRIKSLSADITVETARALGYQLGNLKTEEVFALAKRETLPQTIYKKQKLDRDDIIDITDMDVVRWIKGEMRVMLNEELARAILIGDGRLISSDDKIFEDKVRPIWTDAAFYTYRHQLALAATTADIIDSFVSARQYYKGSGNPTAYVAPSLLTSMLLVKDTTGRRIYPTENELAAACRVKRFVEVELMDGLAVAGTPNYDLRAILVNLNDYNVGADRGGEINFFDDFDIDYNQYKYLLETRMSGALIKYRSAVVIEQADA